MKEVASKVPIASNTGEFDAPTQSCQTGTRGEERFQRALLAWHTALLLVFSPSSKKWSPLTTSLTQFSLLEVQQLRKQSPNSWLLISTEEDITKDLQRQEQKRRSDEKKAAFWKIGGELPDDALKLIFKLYLFHMEKPGFLHPPFGGDSHWERESPSVFCRQEETASSSRLRSTCYDLHWVSFVLLYACLFSIKLSTDQVRFVRRMLYDRMRNFVDEVTDLLRSVPVVETDYYQERVVGEYDLAEVNKLALESMQKHHRQETSSLDAHWSRTLTRFCMYLNKINLSAWANNGAIALVGLSLLPLCEGRKLLDYTTLQRCSCVFIERQDDDSGSVIRRVVVPRLLSMIQCQYVEGRDQKKLVRDLFSLSEEALD